VRADPVDLFRGEAGETDPPPGIISDVASAPSDWIFVESSPRGLSLAVAPFAGPRTTAPAPSPKRTHVVRSVQSITRERSSTPMMSTFFAAPERMNWSAMVIPKMKPAHAAERSNAGQ
jgi:hypothetical protein